MIVAALLPDSASRMHISSKAIDIDGEVGSSRWGRALVTHLGAPLRETHYVSARCQLRLSLLWSTWGGEAIEQRPQTFNTE
jgi:hypothetical protein